MLTISWNNKFSIDVEVIDDQHRKLFELTENLNNISAKSCTDREIMSSLDDLIDYTKYHFHTEEKLMRDEGYPKYNMHKIEHDKLTQQAIDYRMRVFKGKELILDEFLMFLFTWLTKHIMDQDKKIGTFLQVKLLQKK